MGEWSIVVNFKAALLFSRTGKVKH